MKVHIFLVYITGEFVFHTSHASDNLILSFFGRKSPGILNSCASIDINSKFLS